MKRGAAQLLAAWTLLALALGCSDRDRTSHSTISISSTESGSAEGSADEPRHLEIGDAEDVAEAAPPDELGRDRAVTGSTRPEALTVRFAPMDLMTATRNSSLMLLVDGRGERWTEEDIQAWAARCSLRTASGRRLDLHPTYVPSEQPSSYPVNRIQLEFSTDVRDEWLIFSFDDTGLSSSVSGAIADASGTTFSIRFRVDSHPIVTHIVVSDAQPGRQAVELRMSERITVPHGAEDVVLEFDGRRAACVLETPTEEEALDSLRLVCDAAAAERVRVQFESEVTTAEGTPVFGNGDRTPVEVVWVRATAAQTDGRLVGRVFDGEFLITRGP